MHTPTFSALSMVIFSHRTPTTPEELEAETAALLTHEGFKPDREEIRAAIMGATAAGNDAILLASQADGTFSIQLDPPKLLALDDQTAVPLRYATRRDLQTHRAFMKTRRAAALEALA